jgi:hypothetical protein
MLEIKSSFLDYVINPLDKFTGDHDFIVAACGQLPMWVMEWCYYQKLGSNTQTLKDFLDTRYGFGLYKWDNTVIEADGTYKNSHPEEEDLYPLIALKFEDWFGLEPFYQYEHAIVAIPEMERPHFVTRMD